MYQQQADLAILSTLAIVSWVTQGIELPPVYFDLVLYVKQDN